MPKWSSVGEQIIGPAVTRLEFKEGRIMPETEHERMARELRDCREDRTRLEYKVGDLEANTDRLASELNHAEAVIGEKQTVICRQREKLEDLEEKYGDAEDSRERLLASVEVQAEQIRALRAEVERLTQRLAE